MNLARRAAAVTASFFCVAIILGSLIILSDRALIDLHRRQVYEYHDVRVVAVYDLYTWRLAKSDGEFTVHFCSDYDLRAYNPAPGLILDRLRYQDRGDCASVERYDLGFWWKRDPTTGIAVQGRTQGGS